MKVGFVAQRLCDVASESAVMPSLIGLFAQWKGTGTVGTRMHSRLKTRVFG